MPKPISVASVIESNRLSSDTPYVCLLDLEIVNPASGTVEIVRHIANNPEDVVFNGQTYEKAAFDIQVTSSSDKQADVSLTVKDLTGGIQSYMEQFGGGVGSNVTFYVVNMGNLTQGPEVAEYFQITGSSASEYSQKFVLGAENSLSQTFPRRRQTRDFCQWRYKSEECGYTGGLATCDLTLQGPNGCKTHGRELSYGGFPGLVGNGYRYG